MPCAFSVGSDEPAPSLLEAGTDSPESGRESSLSPPLKLNSSGEQAWHSGSMRGAQGWPRLEFESSWAFREAFLQPQNAPCFVPAISWLTNLPWL